MIKYQTVNNTYQAKEWLISAWNLIKKNPLTWVFMVLIFSIFVAVGSSFFIGKFIVALLLPVLAGGIFIALHNASRDKPIGIGSLFSVLKDKPILKEMLTVGAIGMGVVALTMLLQLLTGTEYSVKLESSQSEGSADVFEKVSKGGLFTTLIQWVWSWALLFGIPLIAINRHSAIPALKHSLLGLMANLIPMFVFFGTSILLVIVSIIPVGLGLLILLPVMFGANYFAFKEIFMEAETEYFSELGVKLNAIAEKQEKSVVYTNNKEHQVSDLKEAYRSLWLTKLLGMALVTIGIIVASYSFYSLQVGTATMGEVLSVETNRSRTSSGGSSYTYKPTFLFTDKHGEKHIAPTGSTSSELNYPVGAYVKISYKQNDYSTVRIHSVKSILYIPLFLWLFGIPIFLLSIKAKKDVDKNGVPPRKSVFLKQELSTDDIATDINSAENDSVSDIREVFSQDNQDSTNNNEQDDVIELVLPKKFTLDFYEEYMHITLSWFGQKTFMFTLAAAMQIGVSLMLFFTNTPIFSTPLIGNLLTWVILLSGVGFLYYTLATWLNKTHIFVSQQAIEIKHKPISWFGNKRLITKNVKQLYSKEVPSTSTSGNRSSSFTLHVLSFDENDMVLLRLENANQALFLEQQIEKYLGIINCKVRGEIG